MQGKVICGYRFYYDETCIRPAKASDFDFADPACMQAITEAVEWHKLQSRKMIRRNGTAYVYVALDNHKFPGMIVHKIGSSFDPYGRQANCYIGEVQFVIECPTRQAAFDLEFSLHRRYERKRMPHHKEWFALSPDDLAAIKGSSE